MIVSVLVRRLKDGCTFDDFQRAREADQGFAVSLDDPRDVISVGFVAVETHWSSRPRCAARTS